MSERLLEEIAFDGQYVNVYLAVREISLEDGRRGGIIIAFGSGPEEVHAAIRSDREVHESARYYFYRPINWQGDREGWVIGKSD